MNKARKKQSARKIICALVCMALALGICTSIGNLPYARAEEEKSVTLFTTQELSLENNQFASSSGTKFPKTPDSWTGGGVDGNSTSGSVIGGVMDLDTYSSNADNYKLKENYPDEFAGNLVPDSPFGPNSGYEGTNSNVLFINARPNNADGTAYGYTSNSLTFNANRYYKIEAWVRTGNFDDNTGAAIRLNGLDDDVAFRNINTVKNLTSINKNNNYGWEPYFFYIASSSYADQTVTISLQVGDSYTDKDGKTDYAPAVGYAFFDNIQAHEISPETFMDMQKNAVGATHTIVKDYSNKTTEKFVTEQNIKNLDFTAGLGDDNWKLVHGENTDLDGLAIGTYNGNQDFDKNNAYHLTADPLSVNGKYTDGDGSVLVISSYRAGAYQSVVAGVASQKFTLERYRYYRISAWVKTQEMSQNGSGATLALSVIRDKNSDEYKGKNLYSLIESCEGDDDNIARGGFKQYSFYVQGSVMGDYEASLECMLGSEFGAESRPSDGIAIFDNITIEEILPATFNSYSSNGTVVHLDTDAGVQDSFRTLPDTGIGNGEFYNIDAYDEFMYPFKPAEWTMYTPETVGTEGYSADMTHINNNTVISGVIPTDEETFNAYYDKFGGAYNYGDGRNLLMLSSKTLTAFCYRSPNFTVSADTPGFVSIELYADNLSGYGASLVLKNDNKVLTTIEGIKNTNRFATYNFYIEPNAADISTLSVEIWLGGNDRTDNYAKRASGHLYVQRVAYTSLTDDTDGDTAATKFAKAKAAYDLARHNGATIGQAAYSFKTTDFGAYDYYDTSYVKTPYNWTLTVNGGENVHYGVFDPTRRPANETTVPQTFKNTEYPDNYSVLMLYNASPAASSMTQSNVLSLTAGSYYQIDVLVKVDIPEQEKTNAVGATISLNGTKFAFTDIKSTSDTDSEAFRKYTFFIDPGSVDNTVSLSIALGDSDSSSKWCSGRVYINSISFTDISESLFNANVSDVEKGNLDYALVARLSEATEDDETPSDTETPAGKSTLPWYFLVPSILFAVAIVITLIGFFIRKLSEKRAAKKVNVQKTASYDRTATLNREYNKNAAEGEKVDNVLDTAESDEGYEAFDDDAVAPEKKEESQPAPSPEETEPAQTAEEPSDAEPANENEMPAQEDAPQEQAAPAEAAPAQPQAEEPKPDNAFIDQFDD